MVTTRISNRLAELGIQFNLNEMYLGTFHSIAFVCLRITEVSRYLNRSPLEIEELLDATKEGADALVAITNEFNELLYDEIIPRMFRQLHHPLDQGRSLKFGERHFL